MADRQGFEPWRRSPAYTLSRRAPSTTRPPVRCVRSMRLALDFQEPKIDFRAHDLKRSDPQLLLLRGQHSDTGSPLGSRLKRVARDLSVRRRAPQGYGSKYLAA